PANTGEIVVDVKTGQFDPDNRIKTDLLTLEQLSATGSIGLVNLADITTYGFPDAQTTTERTGTDFGYLWSSGGFGNFTTPDNGFGGWASQNAELSTWASTERNQGRLVHLTNPTMEEIQTAARITNRAQLIDAFNDAESIATAGTRPGHATENNGPSQRIRRMVAGSIIYFKSEAAGRDLYSVMIVRSLNTASPRRMELLIKSDLN